MLASASTEGSSNIFSYKPN